MTNEREPLPYYDEPPTKLETLVDLVSKNATSDAVGSVHPISVRIPSVPFTTLQAIAYHSGMSMNKTIVNLLDVALDVLWQALGEEDRAEISALRSGYLRNVLAEMESQAQSKKGEI